MPSRLEVADRTSCGAERPRNDAMQVGVVVRQLPVVEYEDALESLLDRFDDPAGKQFNVFRAQWAYDWVSGRDCPTTASSADVSSWPHHSSPVDGFQVQRFIGIG